MTIRIYGLKNCDTCRKALAWLSERDMAHEFVDVRADGVGAEQIGAWADAAGWEVLLNRRGTTWRGLDDAERQAVDRDRAIALMAAHPALIKRPVFEAGGSVRVGFKDDVKAALQAVS